MAATIEAPPTDTLLPPGPRLPVAVQGALAVISRRQVLHRLQHRYGSAFSVRLPVFGPAVVLADTELVRQLFKLPSDQLDITEANLGRVLGEHSMFALRDERHHQHRKLLVPPFHGRRLGTYEQLMEELTLEELATWPTDKAFPVMPSMMRITLNIILRAVFGAEGRELEQLRRLLPRMVKLGSVLAALPLPQWDGAGRAPWGRFRRMRAEYDGIVDSLIARASTDPRLDERDDVLALMLQARYDDGSALTRDEVADQLITLLAAGHETTATTLAWAVERLRRHPDALDALVADLDGGRDDHLKAVVTETQRNRSVIDTVFRQVRADAVQLGPWTLPHGHLVIAPMVLAHEDPAHFPDPERFDPSRFLGERPDLSGWLPFGGGARRCIGSAFATMELHVVLRTMLRDLELVPTSDRAERWHSRGVAYAPARGGVAVVRPRRLTAA